MTYVWVFVCVCVCVGEAEFRLYASTYRQLDMRSIITLMGSWECMFLNSTTSLALGEWPIHTKANTNVWGTIRRGIVRKKAYICGFMQANYIK